MSERDLVMGDVIHILKTGYVYKEGVPATRPGLYRYAIEGKSPNSNNRTVRIIVIPSSGACELKIVSVMWADEPVERG